MPAHLLNIHDVLTFYIYLLLVSFTFSVFNAKNRESICYKKSFPNKSLTCSEWVATVEIVVKRFSIPNSSPETKVSFPIIHPARYARKYMVNCLLSFLYWFCDFYSRQLWNLGEKYDFPIGRYAKFDFPLILISNCKQFLIKFSSLYYQQQKNNISTQPPVFSNSLF